MKTIYIVTTDHYGYGICGVFDSMELAQRFVDSDPIGLQIEEYDLNPHEEELRNGLGYYHLKMDIDGNVMEIYRTWRSPHIKDAMTGHVYIINNNLMTTTIIAKDKEQAIEIANQRRILLIKRNWWTPGKSKHLD